MPHRLHDKGMFRILRELKRSDLLAHFNNYTGVFSDEPKFYFFNAVIQGQQEYSDGPPLDIALSSAGVSSVCPEEAMAKCLGEAVERISLTAFRSRDISTSSYRRMLQNNASVLDPVRYRGGGKNLDIPFGWVRAVRMHDGADSFVPAQLVYLNYSGLAQEPPLSPRLSTGAAGDFDLDNALLRGIYEIVERDAFMIAWLLRVKLPRVDLNLLENRTPVDIAERFRQYRLSPYVFDMTNDLAIPAYLTILRDETGIGPPVTVGLKAGYDRCRAIEGSLLESFSPRPWLRMQAPHAAGMPAFANPLTIDTFSKRAAYWRKPSALKSLEYLTAQQPQRIAAAPDKGPESLSGTVQRLKNFGYDLWYVPLSNEVLESTGYQVVKVVAPGLQPLYLKEADKEVRSERLSRAASFFRINTRPVNPIPHPFL